MVNGRLARILYVKVNRTITRLKVFMKYGGTKMLGLAEALKENRSIVYLCCGISTSVSDKAKQALADVLRTNFTPKTLHLAGTALDKLINFVYYLVLYSWGFV